MKKFAIALAMLSLFLVACSSPPSSQAESQPAQLSSSIESVQVQQVVEPEPKEESPTVSGNPIQDFTTILDANGVGYSTLTMAAEYVEADEGIKYTIGDGKVELYVFDISGEAWAQVVETGQMSMSGFGSFDCFVNEQAGAAMLLEGVDEAQYIEWFSRLK